MKLLSLIVPVLNEEEAIPLFYEAVQEVLPDEPYELEILFVDDGSTDRTLEIIEGLHARDPRVRAISFSRNFGKEAGLYAGLQHASGDYISLIDADLQQRPEIVRHMVSILDDLPDYDVVAAYQDRRGEGKVLSFFKKSFYSIINALSDVPIKADASDFRTFRRSVRDSILEVAEYHRFSKGIFGWIGFRTKWLPYKNVERVAGETKWNFWKLLVYSVEGITAFSTAPLMFASLMGVLFCVLAFAMIAFTIFRKIVFGDPVSGWPSLVCIISLVSGVQLFCLGILGQYLSKTYMEVKKRPIYLVKEEI